jgi:hypothetical protein
VPKRYSHYDIRKSIKSHVSKRLRNDANEITPLKNLGIKLKIDAKKICKVSKKFNKNFMKKSLWDVFELDKHPRRKEIEKHLKYNINSQDKTPFFQKSFNKMYKEYSNNKEIKDEIIKKLQKKLRHPEIQNEYFELIEIEVENFVEYYELTPHNICKPKLIFEITKDREKSKGKMLTSFQISSEVELSFLNL